MDRIQRDALNALNDYINIVNKEYQNEYSEKYSTQLWALNALKEELLLHDQPPLLVIDSFCRKLVRFSYDNFIFTYAANAIESFMRTIL